MQRSLEDYVSTGITNGRTSKFFDLDIYRTSEVILYKAFVQKCGLTQELEVDLHHVIPLNKICQIFRYALTQKDGLQKVLSQVIPKQFQNLNLWNYITWYPNNLILGPKHNMRLSDPKGGLEIRFLANESSKEWKNFIEKLEKHDNNIISVETKLDYLSLARDFLTLPPISGMKWEKRGQKYECVTFHKNLANIPPHLTDARFLHM